MTLARLRGLGRALTACREDLMAVPEGPRWAALAGLAVAPLLAVALAPSWALAQGAGCSGQSIIIQSLDNLLQTAWEYLTGGPVIRLLAAAFFIFGVANLISRRAGAAAAGIGAGAITAFVPNILNTLFSQGKTTISLCG